MTFSFRRQAVIMILAALGTAALFGGVFSLYQLPQEAFLYALLLDFCFLAVLLCLQYLAYRRRRRLLAGAKQSISMLPPPLPPPADGLEADYQALLSALEESRAAAIRQKQAALFELSESYSLWAHQIKTPIAAMHLLLQSGEADPEELLEQLFSIEQYVDMALGFVRAQSLSGDLLLRRYDLDTLLRQSVRKFSRLFIRKKISLHFAPTHMQILTDEKWFRFVVEQLLSNALKYTPQGSISLYAEAVPSRALVIEDTGIGIAPEDLPRLGERGFTGYNGRIEQKSTGLGLYLCRRILSRLSLSMEITSAVGQGTRVRIGLDIPPLEAE